MSTRRRFLREAGRGLALLGTTGLSACSDSTGLDGALNRLGLGLATAPYEGDFVGQRHDRGHRLRSAAARPAPDRIERTDVVIAGGGIAGLSAARALQAGGIEDYRLFDLEDEAGGNSRGGIVGGYACPWGAHYLPTPGPYADEVAALLDEYRLRRVVAGRAHYDELTLCHSPQERLHIAGGWQDGLLPVRGQDPATFAAYRQFARRVREAAALPRAFTIPTRRSAWSAPLAALDAQSFAHWLDAEGLRAPALRWYLDYCCRDDYGAGSANVSAWAGLHYFASRHGFSAPGDADEPDRDFEEDGVLTWPEGNAWLARRLAAPQRERTATGALVVRIAETRHEVEVDVLDLASRRLTRWIAQRAIVATPLFVAARLIENPPQALRTAAAQLPHAPWLVANIQIDAALDEQAGNAPLSWDNVVYGSPGLGYVNAMNQSTRAYAGATVLSYYRAFGDDPAAGRKALLERGWRDWSETILAELAAVHPDLRAKTRRVEIMRYGHAMAIPAPGVRGSDWLAALARPQGRIAFAHSDLSAYSVFEEAFDAGLQAGRGVAAALRGRVPSTRTSPPR
ncbi:MAG: NAD(P)/FAD-dependent oxidoreductase [Nevskia sp.]